MGSFSAEWLTLRESTDARSRSAALSNAVGDRFAGAAAIRILDLGAGAGANVRYLIPVFSGRIRKREWLLADSDAALLALAPSESSAGDVIEKRVIDLDAAFGDAPENLCAGRDLVTASALLDLVSGPWLDELARRCRVARSTVLFLLTYNGEMHCSPAEPEDDEIRELVNRHQRTDKGFGPALGPDASEAAARAFALAGYQVRRERSDWRLTKDHQLQTQLVEGWADSAEAIAPDRALLVSGWKARRLQHVGSGRSTIIVGHEDMAAWLP